MLKRVVNAIGSFVRYYLIYPWASFGRSLVQFATRRHKEEAVLDDPTVCARYITERRKARTVKGSKIPVHYVLRRCKHKAVKNGYCRQHQKRK